MDRGKFVFSFVFFVLDLFGVTAVQADDPTARGRFGAHSREDIAPRLRALIEQVHAIQDGREARAPEANPPSESTSDATPSLSTPINEGKMQAEHSDLSDSRRPPRVVSLIVNGSRADHLSRCFSQLSRLRRSGVLIGDVLIVGKRNLDEVARLQNLLESGEDDGQRPYLENRLDTVKVIRRGMKSLNLATHSVSYVEPILSRFKVSRSPTWIVRDGGYDHVYEGDVSIGDLLHSEINLSDEGAVRF